MSTYMLSLRDPRISVGQGETPFRFTPLGVAKNGQPHDALGWPSPSVS
jgi:hypothetical protein